MTENHIIFDDATSGLVCKISCPDCNSVKTLSKTTGNENFSIFNFSRHYAQHELLLFDESHSSTASSSDIDLISFQNENNEILKEMASEVSDVQRNENVTLKEELVELTEKCLILENELEQRCNISTQ